MDTAHDPFSKANYLLRKASYVHWHRQLSKQHILRSQLGFHGFSSSRPKVCEGCENYHGISYGYSKENRTMLVCGMHPYGWQQGDCPDWQNSQ